MGSRAGAETSAARKAGVSVQEYRERRSSGIKRCVSCREWKHVTAFGNDRSRGDGRAATCLRCRDRRYRKTYRSLAAEERRQPGPQRIDRRDGDRLQARSRINHDVRMGLRPNANDLHCAFCGHKGCDRRHEYHHHMGYAARHHNDVLPVCSTCHAEVHRG